MARRRPRCGHVTALYLLGVGHRHSADVAPGISPVLPRFVFSPLSGKAQRSAHRYTLVRLAFDRIESHRHWLPDVGFRRVHLPRSAAKLDGPDSRRAHDFACVGGDASDHRMDLACRCFGLPGLRLARPLAAAALDPPRLWFGPDRRPHVYDPRRNLRRTTGCRRDVHHSIYDLRRGA